MCIVSLLPRGSDGKESACQCRRPQFDSWVGKIPGRREWLLTPVFWPGEFCGQRSLEGCSSWSCKESNTTEWPILSRNSKVDFTNLFECKILFLGILLDPWSMEHTLRSTHLIQCRPQIAFTEIMEIQQGRCLPQPQVSGLRVAGASLPWAHPEPSWVGREGAAAAPPLFLTFTPFQWLKGQLMWIWALRSWKAEERDQCPPHRQHLEISITYL